MKVAQGEHALYLLHSMFAVQRLALTGDTHACRLWRSELSEALDATRHLENLRSQAGGKACCWWSSGTGSCPTPSV